MVDQSWYPADQQSMIVIDMSLVLVAEGSRMVSLLHHAASPLVILQEDPSVHLDSRYHSKDSK